MKWKLFDLLVALALLLAVAATEAPAQSGDGPDIEEDPFEVGAQLTFIGINFPERVVTSPPVVGPSTVLPRDHVSVFGLGGRFAYNAYEHLAFEAEVNHLPERNFEEVFQSSRTQVFGGVRAGRRWEKVGGFAKARIGGMRFAEYGIRGPCTFVVVSQDCFDDARTFLAFDVGGVFEYYPTKRTIFRVDAGDTIVNFRDSGPVVFPPIGTSVGSSIFRRRETTHNFQLSFGFGFRF